MTEYRSLLERAGSNAPPPDLQLERVLRRRDRKRRNQRIAAGAVGIAVFVAAVLIVTTGGSFNRTQQPAIQPTPAPNPSLNAAEPAYLIDLNTGEMTQLPKSIAGIGNAVSPDGTMVAFASLETMRGTPQVFIASLDGTDVQQLTHSRGGAWAPDWSPDGAAIAYTSLSHTSGDEDVSNIFVRDLATGETSQVTSEKPPTKTCYGQTVDTACAPLGAAFPQLSPDGASILYDVHRIGHYGVRIVPVTGGKSVLLVDGATGGTLSPDGSTLAVARNNPIFGPPLYEPGIYIAHADGTNLRSLVGGHLSGPKWSPDGTRIAYIDSENLPDYRVFVVDVATGETTFVAEGADPEWLDDQTLIIVGPR